jgi:two-component system, LuxR family, response regulator FixJ
MDTAFVVDADPETRRDVGHALESAGIEHEVYDSAESFLESYRPRERDCLLLGIEPDGLVLLDRVCEQADLPVVVLGRSGHIAVAVEAMKHGAVDYLEKPAGPQDLVASVRSALDGGAQQRAARSREARIEELMRRLTPRQREVLDLVVEGYQSKDIAVQLGIAKKTVDLHRSELMARLEAQSIVDLISLVLTGSRPRGRQRERR